MQYVNPSNAELNPICHLLALLGAHHIFHVSVLRVKIEISKSFINPLNAELNPICHLLALLGAHHILHVSRIRVNFFYPVPCLHDLTNDETLIKFSHTLALSVDQVRNLQV